MTNPNRTLRKCAIAILFLYTFGRPAELLADETQASWPDSTQAAATQPANDPAAGTGQTPAELASPRNDRIFWSMPNYLTVENSASAPPLTTGEKFKAVAQGTFDPFEVAFIGLEASINQASNSDPTLGRGFTGYAKRYGMAYADTSIANFMTSAVMPTALHQDPRYFTMGKGNFFRRAAYAASRVLITRSDSGRTEFNFSEILGNSMAAGLANAYHPAPRTITNSIRIAGTQTSWDAFGFELREFWPDIHRLFQRHHHKT